MANSADSDLCFVTQIWMTARISRHVWCWFMLSTSNYVYYKIFLGANLLLQTMQIKWERYPYLYIELPVSPGQKFFKRSHDP